MFIHNLGALKMEKRVFFFVCLFYCLLSFCWGMDSAGGYYIFNLKKKKSILEGKYFFPFPAELS